MFTGIITDISNVLATRDHEGATTVTFERPAGWGDLAIGESIATNGVCLTIAALRPHEYDCVLMAETLSKTSFGHQFPPRTNLERALRLSDRLSGHLVQGHVDGVGRVTAIQKTENWVISVKFPEQYQHLVIYKGSITLNGVSLTISATHDNSFEVSLIPHTLKHTTIGELAVDDAVNLEFDMVGKYISKLIGER